MLRTENSVSVVGPYDGSQNIPIGMGLAYERLMVPLLSLVPNNPSEPCALELASARGTLIDRLSLLSCGLNEALINGATMRCELSSPLRYTRCSHSGFVLAALKPSCRPYVLVKMDAEFVLGFNVG